MHRKQIFFALLALVLSASFVMALPNSPLVPTYNPVGAVSLTFQKGTNTAGTATTVSLATAAVATGPATSTFFTVDPTPANLPIWLSVSPMSGTVVSPITQGSVAGTPVVVTLNASAICASLGSGTYSTTLHVQVLGNNDLTIAVTLMIKDAAPTLSVTGGNNILNAKVWNIGTAQTAYTIPLVSNGPPISFTTSLSSFTFTGTPTPPVSSPVKLTPANGGLAYTWGTNLTVTLDPLVYATAQAGGVVAGTITINCPTASPTSIAVPFNLTIGPAIASISSLFPASVPVDVDTADTVNVTITGSGFVVGALAGAQTTVVFLNGVALTAGVSVLSSTTISAAIPVTSPGPFDTAGTPAVIGVANPNGGTANAPPDPDSTNHASAHIAVTNAPIITAITSASTFLESGTNSNTFAPYDIISVFGTSFCPDCGGGNPSLLPGAPDTTYYRYTQSVSPDSGGTQHYVTVQFNKHSDSSLIAQGYILFANNTQINVLVPAAVGTISPTLIGNGTVDVVVSYSQSAPPAAPGAGTSSAAYPINIAAVDPGILTVAANGTGQGAILNGDYSLNGNSSSAAAVHGTGTVMVYMTGLGAPSSAASNATTTSTLAYPGSCISALGATGPPAVVGYLTTMNTAASGYTPPTAAWTSLDGAIIQSAKIVANGTSHYPPCMGSVTATINGASATVTYAGWVADSIAGLYQVNLTVPSGGLPNGASGPTSVPVVVTIGGKSSQAGVTMWVK